MKAILEFDLNDYHDKLAHKRAIDSQAAYIVLNEIADKIFRPNRKHGYTEDIEKLLEQCSMIKDENGNDTDAGTEVILKLEEIFYEILNEQRVNLDDLD